MRKTKIEYSQVTHLGLLYMMSYLNHMYTCMMLISCISDKRLQWWCYDAQSLLRRSPHKYVHDYNYLFIFFFALLIS